MRYGHCGYAGCLISTKSSRKTLRPPDNTWKLYAMEYSNFIPNNDTLFDTAVIRASLLKIDELMSTGESSSWVWRPNDVKLGKIAHYAAIIAQLGPIPRPAFRLEETGELLIMSGRHRNYALLDAGYSIIEICTLPDLAGKMQQLVGISDEP